MSEVKRFIFQPENWPGGYSTDWWVETVDLQSLQLTDEEAEILLIQPVCSIFPEAAKTGEWKLIVDREIQNEMIRSYNVARSKRLKELDYKMVEGKLDDGTTVYYPCKEGKILKGLV